MAENAMSQLAIAKGFHHPPARPMTSFHSTELINLHIGAGVGVGVAGTHVIPLLESSKNGMTIIRVTFVQVANANKSCAILGAATKF